MIASSRWGPGTEPPDANSLALQVADGADGFVGEQLDTADVHARQRGDRLAGIHLRGHPRGGVKVKIDLTARDRIDRRIEDAADLDKPFGAQQFVGDVRRGKADIG
jgi:hypothetical protein